ncbi:hypothetical protein E1B28_004670 [Marasmius oreades]|uniref:DNA mismatch repair protein MLH3 n=1 Tax=Marasmius oreades TaxID=181124 RepID=A0A9P7UZ77_9AGAR|nr:uncharacterized protein E1B28_004670 [Marasmius oreades]KAG7097308.1 hypothetical protein E1B28_004670 [Marasmius oreades]
MAGLPIEFLPFPTRTKLRSTQILTSLPQIVSELCQNSLDAGSRHIEIGVNCEEWMCWVTDDGHGISKDGLSLLGTDARYGSSKAYSLDSLSLLSTFGFRGEALASASDLGCLEISSRTSRSRETWSIILKGGKTIYTGAAVRWKRTSQGTTVCVRDAFHNIPVRRLSHPTPLRSFEIIRREIESYALVFPHISFHLQFTAEAGTKENLFRIPKSISSLEVFRRLYGKALSQHVHEINVNQDNMRLEGFISLEGSLSKSYQFLYVNHHPVEHGDLQRIIESRFSSSSFAKHAYEESGETSLRPSTRRSPRKAEKKAVYVLNLTIPPDRVDNLLEPAKGSLHFGEKNAVESFLVSTVNAFLIRYGFSLPTERVLPVEHSPPSSPRKRRKLDSLDDSGCAEEFSEELNSYESRTRPEIPQVDPLYIGGVTVSGYGPGQADEIVWTDAITGQTFVVDSRTGHSRLQGERSADAGGTLCRERRTLGPPRIGTSSENHETPDWIRRALEANECYKLGEQKIRSLGHLPCHEDNQGPGAKHLRSQTAMEHGNESMRQKFVWNDVREAAVISQVDRKFVACTFNNSGDGMETNRTTLVLIDQHAADERIRVELFLKDLCVGFLRNIEAAGPREEDINAVETRHLTPAVPILLTCLEVKQLMNSQEVRDAFWSWGICFANRALDHGEVTDSVDGDDSGGYAQIAVHCIPEVVADKLLSADGLRDTVKSFLAQVNSGDIPYISRHRESVSESEGRKESDWLKALRWCPRHLLDLVNSKACRGAIMFNDTLSDEQCERLLKQLSATALPFQCAHGRPSLVPLTNFGQLLGDRGNSRHSQVNWTALEEQMNPD